MKPPQWILEPLTEEDLDEVIEIERACFSNPWPPDAFLPSQGDSWARVLVLRDRHRPSMVRGYICFWMLQGEMEIQNVAVRMQERRTGGARYMLVAAIEEARRHQCRSAWLEVRPSNMAAINLYQGLGFRQVGVRKRYYDDGEDALLMHATLPPLLMVAGGSAAARSLKGPRSGC